MVWEAVAKGALDVIKIKFTSTAKTADMNNLIKTKSKSLYIQDIIIVNNELDVTNNIVGLSLLD